MGEKLRRTKPWYLAVLAVLLMLGGVLNSFLGFGAYPSVRGSAFLVSALIYMQILWLVLAIAGFGISQGRVWSRLVMSAAFVGIFVGSLVFPSVTLTVASVYFVLFGAAIAITFMPRASAFFERRNDQMAEEHQDSQEHANAG